MRPKRIIPCLDVNAGRVVKGVNFVGLRDAGDPVEIACRYDREGADELALLDISASSEGRKTMLDVIERVAGSISVPLAVGGGVRTIADVERLLAAGASKVSVNTAAVDNPQLVADVAARCGSARLIVAIDAVAGRDGGWEVVTLGGRRRTGLDPVAWARQVEQLGAGEILLTSMDRDGTKQGFDLALTRAVSEALDIPVIASGGVGEMAHLADGLTLGAADAVLAASVFHFGEISIPAAKQFLAARGIPVRLAP